MWYASTAKSAPTAPVYFPRTGEIQQIVHAELRPLDVGRMGVQTYDITHYQPLLFCAEGFNEIEDVEALSSRMSTTTWWSA